MSLLEMEATSGLLDTIKPPRLEDAGLEDCALPPEAIEEAFLKAANSIKCRAAAILYPRDDDTDSIDHLDGLEPSNGEIKDMLLGIPSGGMEPCGTQKIDGIPEMSSDQVLIGKENAEASDRLLGLEIPDNEEKACVEGIQGLEIGEKGNDVHDSEVEIKNGEQPILVEGFIM